jgi:CBS domain containing-hemolysin-like protein
MSQEKVTYDSIDFIVQEIEGHKINSVKIVTKRA